MAKSTNDVLMKEALDRFQESQEASDFNRDNYYEDVKFSRLSDQWPDKIAEQREQEGRPALVINRLPSLIRSVVNEARQSRPAIKVSPVDSESDEDTAEVIGGLIRNIERQSVASTAYDTAIDHAVTGGFGFFRIDIDYAHDETFELEARIKRVSNPLSVHWDTSSETFDASDWDFAFISDMLSKDEFKVRYPGASLTPFDGDSRDENSELWLRDDQIRVAEWFQRTKKETTLLEVSFPNAETGQTEIRAIREESLPRMAKYFFEAGNMPTEGVSEKDLVEGFKAATNVEVLRERTVDGYDVKRRIINGTEVLEEDEWPGQHIPVCPVWGDEVYLDGRRHFRSLIRDAKDPQMMFNFWRSATTELVALAPKAPFIGPKGFIPKGQESKWASANTRSHAFLEYEGNIPPQRQAFAGVPSGAINEATMAAADLNDITGIYPSAIGGRSNEVSGKAIMARERQGDVSNFHFIDNLNRAITYAGKVLVEIMPAVYSPKEAVRILGEDDAAKVVKLTQEAGGSMKPGIDGQKRLFNLSVGKYDVDVKTGPNFATQREETRETLIEIMRQVPDAAAFIGDVLLDHMDFVGADKVAKRLKSMLPPEMRQAEEAAETSDDPEKAMLQQQNQAMQQQMQEAQKAVMAEIEQLKAENEAIRASNQADIMKTQADAVAKQRELDIKDREQDLKETEAQKPEPDASIKIAADMEMQRERMAFEAEQKALDRQLEIDKVVLAAQPDVDAAAVEAETRTGTAELLQMLATALTAPKEIIRDGAGNIIGAQTIAPETEEEKEGA